MAKRLLVIDDSLTIRKLVEISFRTTGWNIAFAPSGSAGLARAEHDVPDLILLDYVLPDMKGIDVCVRLAAQSRTASVPIILMTGKADAVRAEFQSYKSVVDYIGKPFSPQDLVAKVSGALEKKPTRRTLPSPHGAPQSAAMQVAPPIQTFSFKQSEMAAKAIYASLRNAFTQIPVWAKQMGTQPAPAYFGHKLLTPETVNGILARLMPVFRESLLGAELSSVAPAGPDVLMDARLAGWPVADVLPMFCKSGQRTGECRFTFENQTVIVYVRAGEIVLATSLDPVDYAKLAEVNVSSVPPDALAHAQAEQRRSGKPVFVALAEAGRLQSADLSHALRQQSKRLLLLIWHNDRGSFTWCERPLPAYVEAYGTDIAVAQLTLEVLRVPTPPQTADDGEDLLASKWMRREGFSRVVRRFELAGDERRVLAAVDGKSTGRRVAEAAGIEPLQTLAVLDRLARIGLVHVADSASRNGPSSHSRQVLVVDPDVSGFHKPLAELLRQRSEPLGVLSLESDTDLVATVARERPCLVILNATERGSEAEKFVRAIRSHAMLSETPVVALLDAPSATEGTDLMAAGFDAVLTKPISYADIEKVLAA